MTDKYTLYAMSHSLYSGKARSYLIKQHADFREITGGYHHFRGRIVPQLGRWIIPVLETDSGEIIQDGTSIIDWYEANGNVRQSAYPTTPCHLIVAHIFEMFGGEGLLRPAMHYRWNFDKDNLDFIQDQFGLFAVPDTTHGKRAQIAAGAMDAMRNACRAFGVSPESIPAIEEGYLEFLDALNAHFAIYPYLLGGVPTLGDYGLIAPLYAHLGRDPYPSHLMKQRARAVYRWTERMNAPGADMGEFPTQEEARCDDDAIPDTLKTLLRRVASDYLPEIKAMIAFHNDWLADNKISDSTPTNESGLARGIGRCRFAWRGVTIETIVMPYRVFMLQRIQDTYDALDNAARAKVDTLLAETDLTDIITTRCARRVERVNNREIWGAATAAH